MSEAWYVGFKNQGIENNTTNRLIGFANICSTPVKRRNKHDVITLLQLVLVLALQLPISLVNKN